MHPARAQINDNHHIADSLPVAPPVAIRHYLYFTLGGQVESSQFIDALGGFSMKFRSNVRGIVTIFEEFEQNPWIRHHSLE
jgi:hypothetical protein